MQAIIQLPAISILTRHPVSPNIQCQSRVLILAQLLSNPSFKGELSTLPSFTWRMNFYLAKMIKIFVLLSGEYFSPGLLSYRTSDCMGLMPFGQQGKKEELDVHRWCLPHGLNYSLTHMLLWLLSE